MTQVTFGVKDPEKIDALSLKQVKSLDLIGNAGAWRRRKAFDQMKESSQTLEWPGDHDDRPPGDGAGALSLLLSL